MTSFHSEERPTEVVRALQGASPEPPHTCHESSIPYTFDPGCPLSPSGKENDGEAQDKAFQSRVLGPALLESSPVCGSGSGSHKARPQLGHLRNWGQ